MNIVSCGISVDKKDRIWVMTFSRQPNYERFMLIADGEKDYIKIEIYNNEGVLIHEIPIEDDISPFNGLYINGNRLFIINNNDVSVKEYIILN